MSQMLGTGLIALSAGAYAGILASYLCCWHDKLPHERAFVPPLALAVFQFCTFPRVYADIYALLGKDSNGCFNKAMRGMSYWLADLKTLTMLALPVALDLKQHSKGALSPDAEGVAIAGIVAVEIVMLMLWRYQYSKEHDLLDKFIAPCAGLSEMPSDKYQDHPKGVFAKRIWWKPFSRLLSSGCGAVSSCCSSSASALRSVFSCCARGSRSGAGNAAQDHKEPLLPVHADQAPHDETKTVVPQTPPPLTADQIASLRANPAFRAAVAAHSGQQPVQTHRTPVAGPGSRVPQRVHRPTASTVVYPPMGQASADSVYGAPTIATWTGW